MLSRADLKLPDAKLSALLRERTTGVIANKDADDAHRDVAFMFELDRQVQDGGFAQYFFAASCPNAFDAWFAADVIDEAVNELLSHALVRLGVEFGIDLELHRLLGEGGGDAMGKAYTQLLAIQQGAHNAKPSLQQSFDTFVALLGPDKKGSPGFTKIDKQYKAEVDIDAAVVAYVRAEPEAFLSAKK
jgi:hypothetical protein